MFTFDKNFLSQKEKKRRRKIAAGNNKKLQKCCFPVDLKRPFKTILETSTKADNKKDENFKNVLLIPKLKKLDATARTSLFV